jgi:hypothetical protein
MEDVRGFISSVPFQFRPELTGPRFIMQRERANIMSRGSTPLGSGAPAASVHIDGVLEVRQEGLTGGGLRAAGGFC